MIADFLLCDTAVYFSAFPYILFYYTIADLVLQEKSCDHIMKLFAVIFVENDIPICIFNNRDSRGEVKRSLR